jgi:hypothetical protein
LNYHNISNLLRHIEKSTKPFIEKIISIITDDEEWIEAIGITEDGTNCKFMTAISKADLLIIDDFGLQKLDENNRKDLLEIVEDRHGLRSTLVTSILPVSAWYEIIAEPTLYNAILDRITSSAHRIKIKGESMRKTNNFTPCQSENDNLNQGGQFVRNTQITVTQNTPKQKTEKNDHYRT